MAKRRLPLLAPTSDSGASVPTPGHWILAMAALAFTAWLPLSLAALWAAQLAVGRSGDPGVGGRTAALAVVGLLLGSFLLATGLASALVRGTVERSTAADVVWGGALAAVVSCAVAAAAGALAPWPVAAVSVLVLGLTGAVGAALGGRFGRQWALRRSVPVDPAPPSH